MMLAELNYDKMEEVFYEWRGYCKKLKAYFDQMSESPNLGNLEMIRYVEIERNANEMLLKIFSMPPEGLAHFASDLSSLRYKTILPRMADVCFEEGLYVLFDGVRYNKVEQLPL